MLALLSLAPKLPESLIVSSRSLLVVEVEVPDALILALLAEPLFPEPRTEARCAARGGVRGDSAEDVEALFMFVEARILALPTVEPRWVPERR